MLKKCMLLFVLVCLFGDMVLFSAELPPNSVP